jgi:predicted aspartyl protease
MRASSRRLRLVALVVALGAPLWLAPIDTASAAACKMETLQTLPVKVVRGAPLVEGAIDGHALVAMLDTGSFETTLMSSFTDQAGLKVRRIEHASVIGIGGRSDVYAAHVATLEFGPFTAKDVDLDVVATSRTGSLGAVIGVDVLFAHDLEIALKDGEVRVFRPVDCGDAFLAYWDKEASMVPLRRVSPEDPRQIITVRINGVDLRALIDSGAFRSLIDVRAARRLDLPAADGAPADRQKSGGVGSGVLEFQVVPVSEVAIGREVIHDTRIAVGDIFGNALASLALSGMERTRMRSYDMILGQDFLLAHRVLFSMQQERLYFSYLGGRVFVVDR